MNPQIIQMVPSDSFGKSAIISPAEGYKKLKQWSWENETTSSSNRKRLNSFEGYYDNKMSGTIE